MLEPGNLNLTALDQMSDAVAHSVWTFARSKSTLFSTFKGNDKRGPEAPVQGAVRDALTVNDGSSPRGGGSGRPLGAAAGQRAARRMLEHPAGRGPGLGCGGVA